MRRMESSERATLWNESWICVASLPRPIAESWRVLLTAAGIQSALKTPWGWITTTNIIELEAGTFYGGVSLFVLEAQLGEAREVLMLDDEAAEPEGSANTVS
jgi:hypothetical protein